MDRYVSTQCYFAQIVYKINCFRIMILPQSGCLYLQSKILPRSTISTPPTAAISWSLTSSRHPEKEWPASTSTSPNPESAGLWMVRTLRSRLLSMEEMVNYTRYVTSSGWASVPGIKKTFVIRILSAQTWLCRVVPPSHQTQRHLATTLPVPNPTLHPPPPAAHLLLLRVRQLAQPSGL